MLHGVLLSVATAANIDCLYSKDNGWFGCHLISYSPKTTQNELISEAGGFVAGRSLANVDFVDFTNLQVNLFPTNVLELFANLVQINIVSCQMTTMFTKSIRSCNRLKSVIITGNNFTHLPAAIAESCNNSFEFIFDDNQIQTFVENAFVGLSSPERLSLIRNNIAYIQPASFAQLNKLKVLSLRENHIAEINRDTFVQLLDLELRDLSSNRIKALPEIRLDILSLKNVEFNGNLIEAIDPKFADSFPGNRSASLDWWLNFEMNICINETISAKAFDRLELDLCFQEWAEQFDTTTTTTMPTPDACIAHRHCRFVFDNSGRYSCILDGFNSIWSMVAGQHLVINGTQGTDELVKAVYFKSSELQKIPRAVFRNIEFLSIPNTRLSNLKNSSIELCGNLRSLDAAETSIQSIGGTALRNCPQLETIDINGNFVKVITAELFVRNPNLKKVILNRST